MKKTRLKLENRKEDNNGKGKNTEDKCDADSGPP